MNIIKEFKQVFLYKLNPVLCPTYSSLLTPLPPLNAGPLTPHG